MKKKRIQDIPACLPACFVSFNKQASMFFSFFFFWLQSNASTTHSTAHTQAFIISKNPRERERERNITINLHGWWWWWKQGVAIKMDGLNEWMKRMKKTGRNVVVLWRHFTIHFRMIHFGKPKENCLFACLVVFTNFIFHWKKCIFFGFLDRWIFWFFHSLTQPNKQKSKKNSILAFQQQKRHWKFCF